MEYLELVVELNQEMYDTHGEEETQFFYTSSGFIDIIGFGDIMLWNSEEDYREWIEEKNDYEPLKPFLKKKLKEYGKKLVKLSK